MKLVACIFLFGLSIFISYCIGYYNATNDTAFMLSTNTAMSSIAAIQLLEKGELDKIKKLHLNDAELSMAALEDIFKNRGDIAQMPRRFIQYHDFAMGREFEKQTLETLRPKYSRILSKTDAKPTSH